MANGVMRVALLSAWNNRCAWCRRAVAVDEIEIDHVLPESLKGGDLLDALRLHGKPGSYDLQSTSNLVPSCRRCNNFKRARTPPNTPIIAIFLQRCDQVAEAVDRRAEGLKGKASVTRALKIINAAFPGVELSAEQLAALAAVNDNAQAEIEAVTGTTVVLHPSLAGVVNARGWDVVGEGANGVVTVRGSGRIGYTGPNAIMQCGSCGSHGPWNGSRCLTCGMLDDGD